MTRATRSSLTSRILGNHEKNIKEVTKPDLPTKLSKKSLNKQVEIIQEEDKENINNNDQILQKKETNKINKNNNNNEILINSKNINNKEHPIDTPKKNNFLDITEEDDCNLIEILNKKEKKSNGFLEKEKVENIILNTSPENTTESNENNLIQTTHENENNFSQKKELEINEEQESQNNLNQNMSRSSSNNYSEFYGDNSIENCFNRFSDSFAKILQEFFPIVSENYDMMISSNNDLQMLIEMTENNIEQVENRRQHVLGYIESLR